MPRTTRGLAIATEASAPLLLGVLVTVALAWEGVFHVLWSSDICTHRPLHRPP